MATTRSTPIHVAHRCGRWQTRHHVLYDSAAQADTGPGHSDATRFAHRLASRVAAALSFPIAAHSVAVDESCIVSHGLCQAINILFHLYTFDTSGAYTNILTAAYIIICRAYRESLSLATVGAAPI